MSMVIFMMTCVISGMFPYPIFSDYTNITSANMQEINDFYETEYRLYYNSQAIVDNLNWFDSVNGLFERYKDTRVIDIQSGLIYYVQRVGGYNHADVEPIDKENIAIFKQIYGGEWSWTRRPVFVELADNYFVCASINGYPHGQQHLDSGLGGHTCIHFLMSRTHGTDRVDEAHQSAVEYAWKHRAMIVDLLNA